MRIIVRSLLGAGALLLGLTGAFVAQLPAANAAASTGVITNFGPNLQQAAGGVCRQPEGLAIDPNGTLYAASNSDSATTVGHVCVIDRAGRLRDVIAVPAGAVPAVGLLGEWWQAGRLLVLDQADDVAPHGRLLSVDPATHRVATLATGFAFPNGIVADAHGDLYVTDSLQGRVYRLSPDGARKTVWLQSPLLKSTNPDLPVGANGIAFAPGERTLYVANTGNREIIAIPLRADRSAGAPRVFADGAALDRQLGLSGPTALFAPDGIQVDPAGNLFVMANQVDEVQVLSPQARLIHRYAGSGANALDFNASAVVSGDRLFITNMSAADGGINSKLSVLESAHP